MSWRSGAFAKQFGYILRSGLLDGSLNMRAGIMWPFVSQRSKVIFLEEGKGYNQAKVLRFFKNWTPKVVNK